MISKYQLTNLVLQTIDECFQPCLVRHMIAESRQSAFSMVQLAASDSAQQLTEMLKLLGYLMCSGITSCTQEAECYQC